MHTDLAVPFADVQADALRWRLGLAAQPALAVHHVERHGRLIELRVLGASHQVIVGDVWSETVACLGDGAPLPASVHRRLSGVEYRFASAVERLTDERFTCVVATLVAGLAERDDVLVGAFPGASPGVASAVTALALEPAPVGGMAWRTWHAYPQTGELVRTRTWLAEARR